MNQLTHERLTDCLKYDPLTGEFVRKSTNESAGKLRHRGYLEIRVDSRWYRAHRLAWFYVNGEWPTQDLDHVDRDKTNNAISNLRYLTPSQQSQNTDLRSNNTSGYRGVSLEKKTNRWVAKIRVNNKRYYLGTFSTPEEAYRAYLGAASIVHTHNPFVI